MQIVGPWDPKMDELVDRLRDIDRELQKGILSLPDGAKKDACSSLYNNLSAVCWTIYNVSKDTRTRCSSQAVGALLRTVMDSTISVLAFCEDPDGRASAYLDYAKVLAFRRWLTTLKHLGCPLVPVSDYPLEEVRRQLAIAKAELKQCGAVYVKRVRETRNKTPAEILEMATRDGAEHPDWFRDHWWPEGSRRKVLEYRDMGHLDDLLYKVLCSCVHSDVLAGGTLSGAPRSVPVLIALRFWGAGVLRLAESLGISLGPGQAEFLRDVCYRPLQWNPESK